MNISYDGDEQEFIISEISPIEFQAIREFMKLARLTTAEHKFDTARCNTSDPELNKVGAKLSDQIRDFHSGGSRIKINLDRM